MTKHPFSIQRCMIAITLRAFFYFSTLRVCGATPSFTNIDLSTTTLDPLKTGFMITGNAASDQFGYSVSTAGDINNDGYDDIIIGAYGKDSKKGAVYVIYGGQKGSVSNIVLSTQTLNPLTTGFMITGNAANDYLGQASTAGDINQDGYDDIIIGANAKSSSKGAVYLIYGGPKSSMSNIDLSTVSLNPPTTGFMITGNANLDQFGSSLGTAGDINDDGYDDIIVGAYAKNSQKGAAYVIYGGPKSSMSNIDLSTQTLDPLTTGFMITGNANFDYFGYSVSTAGDINNDGYDDVVVGAFLKGGGAGAVYVIYGGPKSSMLNIDLSTQTLDPLTTGFMITGNAAPDQIGLSVSTAGDINQDGYDDIVAGANMKGAAYVIYGGPKSSMSNIDLSIQTLDPLTTGFMITGNAGGDWFGYSVSTAGDINDDGYDDIIVGAYGKNSKKGAAYVIYGRDKSSISNIDLSSQTLNPLTTGFMITGDAVGDWFGWSLSTAGDIDRDGYSDIIIGAEGKKVSQGAAYVISACSSCPIVDCSRTCKQCRSFSKCRKCKNSYLFYQSECIDSCPDATFTSIKECQDCSSDCSSCTSQEFCQTCDQGYHLSNSLCVLSPSSSFSSSPSSSQKAQEKATQAISSGAKGIGSIVCVGSATFPLTALVSKTVQNTRYLNLSVTSDLAEIYQTWDADMISWDIPNALASEDHFKTSPTLFARYELSSPFLANFWPTLLTIMIGFATFISCIMIQKLFEKTKYEGWAYSLVQKFVAGSFNFALAQAYACLDDTLFYLVIDAKTNPFNNFFSWASFICALIFLVVGCLLVFFNFWTVKKYQDAKKQGLADKDMRVLDDFNERNKYWELFYSGFNDEDIWSQSFFAILIIRSTLSSLIITVFSDYPLMQTSYLVTLDGVIILLLIIKKPFNTIEATICQYYFETITLLVHTCTFILSLQNSLETPSESLKSLLSTGIMYLNTALVGGSLGFMFVEICKTIRKKVKASKLKQLKKISQDTQETQNLTLTVPEDNSPQRQNRINREKTAPIENFHLLPGTNQNGNTSMSRLNMESSSILESSFNHENSILPDINQRRKPKRQKRQTILTNVIRRQPRTLNQRQPNMISRNVNIHNVRNTRPFENV